MLYGLVSLKSTEGVPRGAQRSVGASRAPAVAVATLASAIAAQVHAWAAPEHLSLQPVLGVGFLLVAVFQGALAAALPVRSGSGWLIRLGLAVNLALILAGVAAHTPGQPLAVLLAHHHAPGTDFLEQIALTAEAAAVAGLVGLLPFRSAVSARRAIRR